MMWENTVCIVYSMLLSDQKKKKICKISFSKCTLTTTTMEKNTATTTEGASRVLFERSCPGMT